MVTRKIHIKLDQIDHQDYVKLMDYILRNTERYSQNDRTISVTDIEEIDGRTPPTYKNVVISAVTFLDYTGTEKQERIIRVLHGLVDLITTVDKPKT